MYISYNLLVKYGRFIYNLVVCLKDGGFMYVNIDEILEARGKTRYWLSKEVECNYQSLCRLCNNESVSVSFNLLQRICVALDCGVEEILVVED